VATQEGNRVRNKGAEKEAKRLGVAEKSTEFPKLMANSNGSSLLGACSTTAPYPSGTTILFRRTRKTRLVQLIRKLNDSAKSAGIKALFVKVAKKLPITPFIDFRRAGIDPPKLTIGIPKEQIVVIGAYIK
jgi:hypothetical protein